MRRSRARATGVRREQLDNRYGSDRLAKRTDRIDEGTFIGVRGVRYRTEPFTHTSHSPTLPPMCGKQGLCGSSRAIAGSP